MSLETSRLRFTGVNLVNGAYELQTERQTTMDNILFIPGLAGRNRLKLLQIQSWGDIAWDSMNGAYFGCSNMIGTFTHRPNLSGVSVCFSMFRGCTSFNSPIGNWDTSTITDMSSMFNGASAFNQAIGSWNTVAVTAMNNMFQSAVSFNQNLSSWNVGQVTNMSNMFNTANSFNQNLGSWNLRLASVNMTSFFAGTTLNLSTENYSRTLIGWANYVSANSNTPASVTMGAGNRTYNNTAYTTGLTYNDAVAARAYLTGVAPDPAWTITDGGVV
jgi:surface protein